MSNATKSLLGTMQVKKEASLLCVYNRDVYTNKNIDPELGFLGKQRMGDVLNDLNFDATVKVGAAQFLTVTAEAAQKEEGEEEEREEAAEEEERVEEEKEEEREEEGK
jgi:hypothetical protein